MKAVPPRPQPAADEEAETPANGTLEHAAPPADASANGTLPLALPAAESTPLAVPAPGPTGLAVPSPEPTLLEVNGLARTAPIEAHASDGPGPAIAPDPGLYAVLGVDPSASDAVIQTTYRRLAAKLLGSGASDITALRQLNVAYELLGNPVRRAEYDRARLTQSTSGPPTPIRTGPKVATQITRRRRPRHAVQPRYAGTGDVVVVLAVVGLASLVGALVILPRLSINLSALNVLQNVLPLASTPRRVIDTTVTPAPATAVPTATPRPGTSARFAGTTVAVSNPTPAQNAQESVVIKLRQDNQPAANFDVWALVQYRTTQERWPATGSVKTDGSGSATISFNTGATTPNYPVKVQVFAQVDDQQLSWSTTFTPH